METKTPLIQDSQADAVWTPLALAHVIVDWLYRYHASVEEKAAAVDIAKRLLEVPRRSLTHVTALSLSNGVPIPNQSTMGMCRLMDMQDHDSCQSPDN